MKRIITIGREFGAGGGELGRRLARELGITRQTLLNKLSKYGLL